MIFFKKISDQERINFAKNLSVILKSGISINEALGSLSKQIKNKYFKKLIIEIKKEVEMGTPLSEAFSKQEKTFGSVFISLIKAGEASGTLEENLDFLNLWLERNKELKDKINSALLYPKIVLAATFLLGGGLAIFILPKLTPLFSQLEVELPLATKILLVMSNFLEKYWFFVILTVPILWFLFKLINRNSFVRRFFHAFYLKIPFLGNLIMEYQMALISQLLATLFKGGFSINETLKLTSGATTNIKYKESLMAIRNRINKGITFSEAMEDYKNLYTMNFVNIVATGEKSGTLENSFFHLSEFYSKEVDAKTKKMPVILEPLLLLFIGLVVGFVALSIIMPIYELTSGLSR